MTIPINIPRNHFFLFLLFSAILILNRAFGYIGHYGFDDMEYAKIAYQIGQGEFPIGNHFAYRFAIVIPTAISYLVFGVNDLASSIPPLIASILTLYFILLFLKDEPLSTLLLSLALTVFSPWFLRYSNMLMPDIYVCLAFVSSVYFIWKAEEGKMKYIHAAIGLSLSLLYGFIAKGTIVLIAPLLLILFLIDLVRKRKIKFWIHSGLLGLSALVVYFIGIYLISGNAFSRFESIGENEYLNRCSYAAQHSRILLKRISVDFLDLMQADHILISFLLLFPLILLLITKRKLTLSNKSHFLLLTAFVLLLSSNFMSISWKVYNPMCLDIRHYLYLIPLVALPLSIYLNKKDTQATENWSMILLLVAGTLITYQSENKDFFLLTLPFAIVLLLFLLFKSGKFRNVFLLLLPFSLIIKPIEMANAAMELNYEGRRDFVREHLLSGQGMKLILTDPVQTNLGNYYLGFDDELIRFADFRSFDPQKLNKETETYYLFNWHTAQQSFLSDSDVPFYLKRAKTNEALAKDDQLAVAIYKVEGANNIFSEENLLLNVLNDFNGEIDLWTSSADHLIEDPKDKTNQVSKVPQYSSTYQLALDSLELNSKGILISVNCRLLSNGQTDAKLVLSIENEEGNIHYSSRDIDPLIKSYSNWWDVPLESAISTEEIKSNAILKVYVWNESLNELYLDDLEVRINAFN